jgi:nitrogen regulatory protein P-II 2
MNTTDPVSVGFSERRLLTVIAESVLEDRLLDDLRRWGVRGLTASRAEGDPFGSRVADIAGAFVRFECVVPNHVAERVLSELSAAYFPRFKVVAYDHAVRVVRPEKYG